MRPTPKMKRIVPRISRVARAERKERTGEVEGVRVYVPGLNSLRRRVNIIIWETKAI
jgi:hypothetical protein